MLKASHARWMMGSLVGTLLSVGSVARAADDPPARLIESLASNRWMETMPTARPLETVPFRRMADSPRGRPAALPLLYAGTVGLQGFDAYSTLTVLSRGGTEVNPVMRQVTRHPAAFLAVKAGAAGLSIVAAERLWRRDHRLSAILLMVASNGFMSYVAMNNAKAMAR